MHHGCLPTMALHGHSPPPSTFITGDQNLLPTIWLKSVVHSPDLFEDALNLVRLNTTILPSITTTHHNGSLPSPMSYTLASNNPPLPSMPTQRFRQNLRKKAPILKWQMNKMGGCTACRGIRSKTRNGGGRLGVLEEIRGKIQTNSLTFLIWFGWWWPRRCLLRQKDKTEMGCWTVAAWTRAGNVACSISLLPTARVPHQDLCSTEMEYYKEEKDGEIRKLWCGECWYGARLGGSKSNAY